MPIKYVARITCPYCDKIISVNREVTVKVPMVPAEKEERYFGERVTQTTLDQDLTNPDDIEGDEN